VEASQFNMRAGEVPAELEDRALRLRRLSGIGVQVRGIVGAANRLYDRPGPEPGLDPDRFRGLVGQELALMELVLGRGDDPVGEGDRAAASRLDRELSESLRKAADDVAAHRERMGDVLASVSMLGRLDHIRTQLAGFPEWQA
jgi:hypothetical protein